MPRIRSRRQPFPAPVGEGARRVNASGSIIERLNNASDNENYPYEFSQCTDEVNRYDKDNDLDITFTGRQIELATGHTMVGGDDIRFNNRYLSGFHRVGTHNSGMTLLVPSISSVALTTLARSNPTRPQVSVPNFIYELKDLPGMIRDIGNLKRQLQNTRKKGIQQVTAKNSASHLLSYQMGWAPLIGDLRKLLDFQAHVDKSMRNLQGLYNNGGLQRRVRLPEWKATTHEVRFSSLFMESGIHTGIRCRSEAVSTIERWGTVRWYPAGLPDPRFSSKDMAGLARDIAFGVHRPTIKQLWDAIPWTWLIGWFSNADDFMQAHSNTIPLTHSTPCVMTKIETRISYERADSQDWLKGGRGVVGYSTKQRRTNSGSLSATIPFLNRRQLSILGALAIQRKR